MGGCTSSNSTVEETNKGQQKSYGGRHVAEPHVVAAAAPRPETPQPALRALQRPAPQCPHVPRVQIPLQPQGSPPQGPLHHLYFRPVQPRLRLPPQRKEVGEAGLRGQHVSLRTVRLFFLSGSSSYPPPERHTLPTAFTFSTV